MYSMNPVRETRRPQPARRGVPRNFTLDQDASALLDAMVVGPATYGRLVSELIRREASLRADRPTMLRFLRQEAQEAQDGLGA